jgi:hypothetical protein
LIDRLAALRIVDAAERRVARRWRRTTRQTSADLAGRRPQSRKIATAARPGAVAGAKIASDRIAIIGCPLIMRQ